MSQLPTKLALTLSEYLQGELTADNKHEFIEGDVYAMAGASESHNTITLNFAAELRSQLKRKHCKPFMADMMVSAAGDVYYPDVMVICDEHKEDSSRIKHAPRLIVEVLSQSTRAFDHSTKQTKYLQIPSLEYYILVEQDFCEISVLSRAQGFIPQYYYLGDDIKFPLIDAVVNVNDIYDRIDNEDKKRYLASLAG
ncbi:MAG: Uma2 family endonuclease [Phenylobacterium sp.]|jgi:Uma2 family endonuclease